MKRILLTLAVCAMMAAPALADIAIPWETNPYGTYQRWDFLQPGTVIDEGLSKVPPWIWYLAYPETNGNPNGLAEAYTYLEGTCPSSQFPVPGWYSGLVGAPATGIYYGHDAYIALWIPNSPNPNLTKILQVEVGYLGDYVPGYTEVDAGGSVVSDPVEVITVDPLDPYGWQDITITWTIYPQPNDEWIYLHFTDSGATIDYIEAATVCVPAPGGFCLAAIGVAFVGWLRRRRTI